MSDSAAPGNDSGDDAGNSKEAGPSERSSSVSELEEWRRLFPGMSPSSARAAYEGAIADRYSIYYQVVLKEREIEALKKDMASIKHPSTYNIPKPLADEFKRQRERIRELEEQLRKSKDELDAVNFKPDSLTGRQLLAKCKSLADENEELGRKLSEGAMRDLQARLALQTRVSGEYKRSLEEANKTIEALDREGDLAGRALSVLRERVAELSKKLAEAGIPAGPSPEPPAAAAAAAADPESMAT
eukprot:tig00020800_g13745.t1